MSGKKPKNGEETVFGIGELVVMRKAGYFTEWNGALGVVVGGPRHGTPINLNTMEREPTFGYDVRILAHEGRRVFARPWQMRRLRDPDQEERRPRHARAPRETPRPKGPVIVR